MPTRVVISILFRELAVIGAKIDIARGLPIIHLNFLGYDEQSHRRGPSSAFAHWTLKGIDDAIARIWRAAQLSAHRHYDVWIYSDHGQHKAMPYHRAHGKTPAEAVAEVCARHLAEPVTVQSNGMWGIQLHRIEFLGGKKIQRLFPFRSDSPSTEVESPQFTIAGIGPVAMIYRHGELTPNMDAELARSFVKEAKIPLVLVKQGQDSARAWTEDGEFTLPEDRIRILGEDHPFLEEATQDLIGLCHHPDAGDFIAGGWKAGGPAYTFAFENGAHGGISPEETTAFALLPEDAPLPFSTRQRGYLYTADLRQAALHLLDRAETREPILRQRGGARETLRVMTYNIHSCIGMDGKLSPERIARVIAYHKPDVVALQELDVGQARTGSVDQVRRIATSLEMHFHFHPARYVGEERFGNAVLSHLPMRLIKSGSLPSLASRPELESRGALWVAVDFNGVKIQIINTHLGLLPRERHVQVQALLGEDWLEHPDCRPPVVLCGDFNARPSSAICRDLRQRLHDAQLELSQHRPRSTFFGRFPTARIDHIFIDPSIEVMEIEVPTAELSRLASDHLPLIVEMRIPNTS